MKRKLIAASLKCCVVILLLSSASAFAVVKLPAIFGTNMVLQQNMKVPVFGWADAGEKVQIDFMGKTYSAVAGADGKWDLKLGSYKAGGPYEMKVTGKSNTLTFTNILIGEVWVAGGQSNMEFGITTADNGADVVAKATDKQIHVFFVPGTRGLQPLYDITIPQGSQNGQWLIVSPETLSATNWGWHGFSAIALYFAQQLRQSTGGAPVGIVCSYKGGTPAQAWISTEGLQQEPAFPAYLAQHQAVVDKFETASATYPQRLAAYRDSLKTWNATTGIEYAAIAKQWQAAVAEAKAAGMTLPARPRPSKPMPRAPAEPDGGFSLPINLYNGMIVPILHYGIKGVIWYQGEANGDRLVDAVEYKTLFPRLITDWRSKWGQGNFPFLFVQLPNYKDAAVTPSEGIWPWVREAQYSSLSLPNTGMPVITDVGEAGNIHPTNKFDPGYRLSLVARHVAYGEKIAYSGPVYKSMKVDGNKIIISFDDVFKGLVAGRPAADGTVSADAKELKGFGIAGSDQKFVWAKAVINGNTVVISSDDVTTPIAVRYNWADNPPGNLYNKDGLPAGPFRTDNWPPPLRIVH